MIKSKKRKICLFSGKRGGSGAYLPLMRLIDKDPALELQILLGDMHASKKFGSTWQEVRKFFPKAKIELIEMGAGRGDTTLIRAENLGLCLQKVPAILAKLKPDIVIVHGDRGEHLMVALAALNLGIPVGHTQGGEVSGNIDDVQRHAITKLAHLHFPETKAAAKRLKKLGEANWRINVAGSVYIDRIVKRMYTPNNIARKKYGLGALEGYFLVLFHPDTYESSKTNNLMAKNILSAIKSLKIRAIVVYPCSDPGYESVIKAIEERSRDAQFLIYKNIENLDFLGLMSGAKAMVGNSSAALVEAPYFKLPAINIGKRQIGRDREENVIDSGDSEAAVSKSIRYALENANFKKKLAKCGRRLGDGHASEKILKVLKSININERLLRKKLVI